MNGVYEYHHRHDYDIRKDWAQFEKQKLLNEYKNKIFKYNYNIDLLQMMNPVTKYAFTVKDERGIDVAKDVSEHYPVSLEEERETIKKTAEHLHFLRKVRDNFEYCRTRCKIMDSRLRMLDVYPREYQMCLVDCANVRTELFGPDLPQGSKKNFVWLT